MLQKAKSRKTALLKYGLSAPLFAGMLVLSSAVIDARAPIKSITEKLESVAKTSSLDAGPLSSVLPEKKTRPAAEASTLKGIVRDADGSIMPGVAIRQESTGRIFRSGSGGTFSIPDYMSNDQLFFDSEGYEQASLTPSATLKEEVPAANQPLTVVMKPVSALAETAREPVVLEDNLPVDFAAVEKAPNFPGGQQALAKYITKNFRWPQNAQEAGVSGKVIVSFVVERDGSMTDIRMLRDLGMGTGAEALRVLKSMPKWNPGIQNGKFVRVAFTLPLQLSAAIN